MTQTKDPCLPVGSYCFSASVPLYMEDYNIHTNIFHVPQLLPLTAVPMIYQLIFEQTQHLAYSSRPWCY